MGRATPCKMTEQRRANGVVRDIVNESTNAVNARTRCASPRRNSSRRRVAWCIAWRGVDFTPRAAVARKHAMSEIDLARTRSGRQYQVDPACFAGSALINARPLSAVLPGDFPGTAHSTSACDCESASHRNQTGGRIAETRHTRSRDDEGIRPLRLTLRSPSKRASSCSPYDGVLHFQEPFAARSPHRLPEPTMGRGRLHAP